MPAKPGKRQSRSDEARSDEARSGTPADRGTDSGDRGREEDRAAGVPFEAHREPVPAVESDEEGIGREDS